MIFRRYAPDIRFKKMKEAGVDYADYPISGELGDMTEEQYVETIMNDKRLADEAGVTIWQVHGPWRYPPHDATEEERAERAEVMARSIRMTAMIGCKNWVIHPIMPYGPDEDPEPKKFWQMNLDFFRALLPIAKENGVTICFENMPMKNLSLSTPEQILKFIHMIDDENFKMCLDTGHANVFGISPADAVRMAGKDLRALHVHDNKGKRDEHLPPYHGIIDWKDFCRALREIEFDGVFSLEAGLPATLPDAVFDAMFKSVYISVEEMMKEE